MAKRYNRRSTRPLEDLPSLFDSQDTVGIESADISESIRRHTLEGTSEDIDDFRLDESFSAPRRNIRFISFGSGSSGNCSYIGTPDCGILIDAGVDNNFVNAELARNGIDVNSIRGIFLTHDHADHVRFAYAILRRNPSMRLYATMRTIEGIMRRHNISRRITDYHTSIFKEHEYTFGDMVVTPFATSHDGTDNVGYSVELGNTRVVVATDMGKITDRADYYMRRANVLVIESNYDEEMLTRGRYPEYLKARIRSEIGHMSNAATAHYLTEIFTPALSHILLCHLSEDNNTPETAVATVLNALRGISVLPAQSSAQITPGTVYLSALPRFKSSELYVI